MHDRKSETQRLITRYVPEFLKHFRRSAIKATRSNTFEATPIIQNMITGKYTYVNFRSTLAAMLFPPIYSPYINQQHGPCTK